MGQRHHPDHLCGYGANAWEPLEGRRKDEAPLVRAIRHAVPTLVLVTLCDFNIPQYYA